MRRSVVRHEDLYRVNRNNRTIGRVRVRALAPTCLKRENSVEENGLASRNLKKLMQSRHCRLASTSKRIRLLSTHFFFRRSLAFLFGVRLFLHFWRMAVVKYICSRVFMSMKSRINFTQHRDVRPTPSQNRNENWVKKNCAIFILFRVVERTMSTRMKKKMNRKKWDCFVCTRATGASQRCLHVICKLN